MPVLTKNVSILVLTAIAVALAACDRTADCRPNTVLVEATCGSKLAGANVKVWLATPAGRKTQVLTLGPCPTTQKAEFALDGYSDLKSIALFAESTRDGALLVAAKVDSIELGGDCSATKIDLDQYLNDAGTEQRADSSVEVKLDAGSEMPDSADAAPTVIPQCMSLQEGALFCLAAEVRRCGPNLTSSTFVETCKAPTPACMGGTCGSCSPGDTRSCEEAGLLGPCKLGTQKCNSNGTWGTCSVARLPNDTCEPNDDSNCNGVVNENTTCACINGSTGVCGTALGAKGTCAAGMTSCVNGKWSACSVVPTAVDDCVFGNDDNCDGTPMGITDSAACQCSGFTVPNSEAGLPNRPSYKDNGDGTVLDNITLLVWEKEPSNACSAEGCTYAQAALYCSSKGAVWRLPTVSELVTLVDFTVKVPGPTINQATFPNTKSAFYWTSSPYTGDVSVSRYINFFNGNVGGAPNTDKGWVRCVRR